MLPSSSAPSQKGDLKRSNNLCPPEIVGYRDSCQTPFLDQSAGEGLNVPPMITMQREQPALPDFGRASSDSSGPHARWLSLIYLENAPVQVN